MTYQLFDLIKNRPKFWVELNFFNNAICQFFVDRMLMCEQCLLVENIFKVS